jgi:hypothetical protein
MLLSRCEPPADDSFCGSSDGPSSETSQSSRRSAHRFALTQGLPRGGLIVGVKNPPIKQQGWKIRYFPEPLYVTDLVAHFSRFRRSIQPPFPARKPGSCPERNTGIIAIARPGPQCVVQFLGNHRIPTVTVRRAAGPASRSIVTAPDGTRPGHECHSLQVLRPGRG